MHLMTPPTPLAMPGHGKGNPPSPLLHDVIYGRPPDVNHLMMLEYC